MTNVEARVMINKCLESNSWGCGEFTEALVYARDQLRFIDFLFDVIQPNEMEQYISMYNSKGGTTSAEDHKAEA